MNDIYKRLNDFRETMRRLLILVVLAVAMAAKADYWMTFCKTPDGRQYSQVGHVKPDADGFVMCDGGFATDNMADNFEQI